MDFDDDLDQDVEEAPAAEQAQPPEEDPTLKKLRSENRSLRTRLRRTELQAKYGEEVVGLIPEELPLKKWEPFAEQLSGRLTKQAEADPTETVTEEAPKVEPPPEEKQLAAVSKGATTTGPATEKMSFADWRKLYAENPQQALSMNADQVELAENPLPIHARRGS